MVVLFKKGKEDGQQRENSLTYLDSQAPAFRPREKMFSSFPQEREKGSSPAL